MTTWSVFQNQVTNGLLLKLATSSFRSLTPTFGIKSFTRWLSCIIWYAIELRLRLPTDFPNSLRESVSLITLDHFLLFSINYKLKFRELILHLTATKGLLSTAVELFKICLTGVVGISLFIISYEVKLSHQTQVSFWDYHYNEDSMNLQTSLKILLLGLVISCATLPYLVSILHIWKVM